MKRMRYLAFLSALFTILLLAFFSTAPVQAAPSWNVQAVDTRAAGMGNGYCPIILDWGGTPLIAYTGQNPPYENDQVKYARWNGSGWDTQTVAGGTTLSFVLDAHNNPHIVYHTGIHGGLMYASWTGLKWASQPVDEDGGFGVVALDSFDDPHVAYRGGGMLKYASWAGSNWTVQTIDSLAEGQVGSLMFDSSNTPYVLYALGSHVKLAVGTNSGWDIQTAASDFSGFGNMVLDSEGCPHFVYSVGGVDDTTIMYSSWDGAAWKTQVVVSGFRLESIGSLALDLYDYPHISYVSAEGLMYAGWTGADWSIQSVDTALSVRGPCYLVVDSNRIPHISYRSGGINDRTNRIMYATATEPVPLSSPPSVFPLLLVLTAVIIGAIVVIVYLWKKKS